MIMLFLIGIAAGAVLFLFGLFESMEHVYDRPERWDVPIVLGAAAFVVSLAGLIVTLIVRVI